MLSKLARGTPHSAIHLLVISWISDAATQYLSTESDTTPTQPDPAATAKGSAPLSKPDKSPVIPSCPPELRTQPELSCPDALLEVLLRLCRGTAPSIRHSALQALSRLVHSTRSLQPHQLTAITSVACYSLTDSAELPSQAAIQLLVALSAPTLHSLMSSAVPAAQQELPWRRLYALQPQQIAFQPDQLAKVLDWLGQGRPMVASQPNKLSGSGSASDEWLWTLLQSCQPINGTPTLPQ